jgi:hypothetical protein
MAIWDDYKWNFWNPETEPLPANPNKIRKISLCTTCMNRTYDLKKTLIKNINDNSDYPNVEFVLLNYNSQDDMEEWVKSSLMDYIKNGRLVYYKTTDPQFYQMGHSRNVAFKLSTGEIVNNIDADNFTNPGFASVINKLAELQPTMGVFAKGKRMMHGRLGMHKDLFLKVGGYDEDLVGYGFDDHSLLYRAMALGSKLMWWGTVCPMDRIKTPRKLVTENMEPKAKKWRDTEKINKEITFKKLSEKQYTVNQDKHWGKATLIKNFEEKVSI